MPDLVLYIETLKMFVNGCMHLSRTILQEKYICVHLMCDHRGKCYTVIKVFVFLQQKSVISY